MVAARPASEDEVAAQVGQGDDVDASQALRFAVDVEGINIVSLSDLRGYFVF